MPDQAETLGPFLDATECFLCLISNIQRHSRSDPYRLNSSGPSLSDQVFNPPPSDRRTVQ
jgi:hypothetical protein